MEKDTMYCSLPALQNPQTGVELTPEEVLGILMGQQGFCNCSYEVLPITKDGIQKCVDILKNQTSIHKVNIKDHSIGLLEVYCIHPQTGELTMSKNYARVVKFNLTKTNSRHWEDDNVEC